MYAVTGPNDGFNDKLQPLGAITFDATKPPYPNADTPFLLTQSNLLRS